MSTRCQIRIEGNDALLYVHSDGYPESVLPDVLPFVATFHKFRGDDPQYLAARLLQHLMNKGDADTEVVRKTMKQSGKDAPPTLNGYGVDCIIHTDIEFYYEVTNAGSVIVNAVRGGKPRRLAEFQLGTNPDDAVKEIKRLQEVE